MLTNRNLDLTILSSSVSRRSRISAPPPRVIARSCLGNVSVDPIQTNGQHRHIDSSDVAIKIINFLETEFWGLMTHVNRSQTPSQECL